MSDKLFLDTNVLVYAYDARDPAKQQKAQEILSEASERENTFISAQVLGEFFVVVTRRIQKRMTAEQAQEVIETLSFLSVQEIDRGLVERAIDMHAEHGSSYWDSLILAAAEKCDCRTVFSEDLADGQEYNGVRVVNPFSKG